MIATLPDLSFDYAALMPIIDRTTMHLHHDKHHAAYVNNLNKVLAESGLNNQSLLDLLQNLERLPSKTSMAVRNNGGGHLNHTLFWRMLTPDTDGVVPEDLAKAINNQFGSLSVLQDEMTTAGLKVFGSGWVWLVKAVDNTLVVMTTANQDNPIFFGQQPILGIDVWEHAYYLTYQNRRADYLNSIWNIINWDYVQSLFQADSLSSVVL